MRPSAPVDRVGAGCPPDGLGAGHISAGQAVALPRLGCNFPPAALEHDLELPGADLAHAHENARIAAVMIGDGMGLGIELKEHVSLLHGLERHDQRAICRADAGEEFFITKTADSP